MGVPPPPPPPPVRKNAKIATAQNADAPAAASEAVPAPEVIKSKIKKPIAVSLHQVIASGQPVALRRVEHNRSPGGTPIKGAGAANAKMLDHSTFLSQALKRKFKHAHNDSPPTTPGDVTPEPTPQTRTSKRNISAAIAEEPIPDSAPAAVAPSLSSSTHAVRSQPKTPVKQALRQPAGAVTTAPTVEEQSLIQFDAMPQPAPEREPEQLLISFDDIAPSPVPVKQAVDDLFMAFSAPMPEDKENGGRGAENKPQSPSVEKRKSRQAATAEQPEDIASPSIKRAATSVRTT